MPTMLKSAEMRHQIIQRIRSHLGSEPGLQFVVQVVDFMFCGRSHQVFSGFAKG